LIEYHTFLICLYNMKLYIILIHTIIQINKYNQWRAKIGFLRQSPQNQNGWVGGGNGFSTI